MLVAYIQITLLYIYEDIQGTHIQMKNSEEIVKICLYMIYLLYKSQLFVHSCRFHFFHHYLLNAKNCYVHAK